MGDEETVEAVVLLSWQSKALYEVSGMKRLETSFHTSDAKC